MKIWTYQHPDIVAHLDAGGHEPTWSRVSAECEKPYRWIADLLASRNPHFEGNPPVWGWHSCGQWGAPPTADDALSLLSAHELESGIVLIELDVPPEQVVLSWYGEWNEIMDLLLLDEPFDRHESISTLLEVDEDLFRARDEDERELQACLPRIDREWVRSVTPLNSDGTLRPPAGADPVGG